MNQTLVRNSRTRMESHVPRSKSCLGDLRERLRLAWKRFHYRQLQRAIRTYSPEKHFLSRGFHPVVGEATMRMVKGEIERNKLPFHAELGRPWLQGNVGASQGGASNNLTRGFSPTNGNELPASLRGPRPLLQAPPEQRSEPVAHPIIFNLVRKSTAS